MHEIYSLLAIMKTVIKKSLYLYIIHKLKHFIANYSFKNWILSLLWRKINKTSVLFQSALSVLFRYTTFYFCLLLVLSIFLLPSVTLFIFFISTSWFYYIMSSIPLQFLVTIFFLFSLIYCLTNFISTHI